ncbi:MAG: 23S rRNA (adenine(2503)-C(2))-methyltransferase RlmN [Nitrospirae bacterium]|nr:23S rRNA (adenine(2503)-C(2))-methyltransferase RlmN [Nitrospirota bacterium]
MKTNLNQLSKEELILFLQSLGQKPYRVNQIINWIYKKNTTSFDDMTDLSKDFRERLQTAAFISNPVLLKREVSKDGTQKFLFELEDGETIESVLIPNNRGDDCFTLCISSQVGCASGCKFCMTGRLGLKRNLKAHEIVDQVIAVKRFISQISEIPGMLSLKPEGKTDKITNIVFMGMGEPFNNFNEVSHALSILTELVGFSKRSITVSTSGIVPSIYKLAEINPVANLAISLNATTDEIRNRIMPINKKYPLKKLIKACREFPLPPTRRITFEYVLLGEINDTREDAQRLVNLLIGIKSKVNLIPFNPFFNSSEFKQPTESKTQEFQNLLKKAGLTVIIRKSMGADISAACGQLKATYQVIK